MLGKMETLYLEALNKGIFLIDSHPLFWYSYYNLELLNYWYSTRKVNTKKVKSL